MIMLEKGVLFELEFDELDLILGTKSREQIEVKNNSRQVIFAGSHQKITLEERKLSTQDLIVLQEYKFIINSLIKFIFNKKFQN